ncbi:LL-diaminopimelate aminotransferase [Hydrogenobacter thermophilus TK-6]|uniref:LL-diaminopimelate aminotransferase n=1 Tax=Hydrogenobacter thermophilus (strain DSM 6534 / IAM 12695 / TK-6) TaxID=608538 RepID=D3DG71_HYDTT|nr:LL-diaminopimelate aminotransferase [Hydrogenobacter thermophilus]ADO44758.1 LL-diaminopimelate aminotransferase [Hydrogenobacter thermophilus TK-6]BAI68823.1 aminotransferase [Hydrogenobacter thermophilus TK-6]
MSFEYSERIKSLPPYLFAQIDKKKKEKIAQGVDVIDLGVGDPDMPTPEPIVKAMQRAVEKPEHHRYPSYEGMLSFREAVAEFYRRRFGVFLDPEKEVITLIGSKEGIAHFPLAFINPDDVVLCPDPAYPVYKIGTLFAGGVPYIMPLKEENNFLPDFKSIPKDVLKRAKIIWVNYPNNPTSAVADESFYRELIDWARENNIIVASDLAYSEIYFGNQKPMSILQIDGAKEVAIEFHSLSKTYNMTGWRIGMAVGNEKLISGLGKVKTNVDSGQFQAIQEAGITALKMPESELQKIREVYRQRREAMVKALQDAGLEVYSSTATFYLWVKVPKGYTSAQFVSLLLDECGIVCTPGNGFGEHGEGYFRISLTLPTERLLEAAERIRKLKI